MFRNYGKGIFFMVAAGILLLSMLMGACAKPVTPTTTSPPSTTTTTTTATATVTTTKTATAPPTTPSPTKPTSVTLMITGGRTDDPDFALAQALASFINADSKWVKAYVLATGGQTDSNQLLLQDPELRKSAIVQSNLAYNMLQSGSLQLWGQNGFEPRIIAAERDWRYVWVTYDPNIKTVQDFKGKTLAVGREGSTTWPIEQELLKAEGVLNDVKLQKGGIGSGTTALLDGKVNAAEVTFDYIYPNINNRGAFLEQLAAKGSILI